MFSKSLLFLWIIYLLIKSFKVNNLKREHHSLTELLPTYRHITFWRGVTSGHGLLLRVTGKKGCGPCYYLCSFCCYLFILKTGFDFATLKALFLLHSHFLPLWRPRGTAVRRKEAHRGAAVARPSRNTRPFTNTWPGLMMLKYGSSHRPHMSVCWASWKKNPKHSRRTSVMPSRWTFLHGYLKLLTSLRSNFRSNGQTLILLPEFSCHAIHVWSSLKLY